MEFSKSIKDELEGRIKKLEDFIESKGFGSGRLTKAKKNTEEVNLAVFAGSIVTVAGIAIWVLNRNHK